MEYGEDLIMTVWTHLNNNKQIEDDKFKDRIKEITKLYQLICRLKRSKNPKIVLDEDGCSDKDKNLLLSLIEGKPSLEQTNPEWKINVIVSSDCIYKSLHPKIQLKINNNLVEMDSERLSELRYDVAKILHRMQHYM